VKAHLFDCTYCIHRLSVPGNKKKNLHEIERCQLTMLPIPTPAQTGRFCQSFHQLDHECKSCIPSGMVS
jgi:hypothetical protein